VRSFKISMALVGAVISSMVIALPAPAASNSGVAAAGFTSDNVQWLSVNPRHTGSSGGRLHDGFFYVTDPRGVTIYNVADPSAPVQTGFLPLPQVGTQTALAQEDPDTNGKILLVDGVDPNPNAPNNGIRLYVVDVTNKAAPAVIGSVATTDHTWSCFADCTYAIGRTGGIIDLTDPRNPKVVSNWKTTVPGSGYTHDFTEIRPGRLMSAGQPSFYMDATDPTKPTKLSTITTKFHTLGYHSAEWPQDGRDKFLLMGTELAAAGTNNAAGSDCTGDGEIATYDTTDVLASEKFIEENPGEPFPPATFKNVDKWRIAGAGTYTDGKAPFHSTLYCAHWFDPHPSFKDGGLIAAAHYDWGTRFLSVDSAGKISEVGWFQPVAGLTASAYWISEDIVYTLDYRRGLDVLRFAGPTGPPPTPDTGLPTERVYFSCGSKVANADGTGAGVAGWDTSAPTTSATAGGGCGSVDSPFTQTTVPNIYDSTFSGTFTGNLNSLTVEAHNLYAGAGRASTPSTVAVRLLVDGEDLTPGPIGSGKFVSVTPVRSATGATELFKFSITNIGFTSPAEAGEHEIQLLINGGTRRTTGPSVNDGANVWVYDATEVPSGITFNPATIEPASTKAKRPAA
jgi:hypothetical protein